VFSERMELIWYESHSFTKVFDDVFNWVYIDHFVELKVINFYKMFILPKM
jgi:hypothetical protein